MGHLKDEVIGSNQIIACFHLNLALLTPFVSFCRPLTISDNGTFSCQFAQTFWASGGRFKTLVVCPQQT